MVSEGGRIGEGPVCGFVLFDWRARRGREREGPTERRQRERVRRRARALCVRYNSSGGSSSSDDDVSAFFPERAHRAGRWGACV